MYLLKRKNSAKTYVGYTNDLRRRLREHKDKISELVYYEAYKDERDARGRERKLKQRGQTTRRLKERLRYSLT